MSRILFLDDNPARQRWARRELGPGNSVAVVSGVSEAILSLMATTGEHRGIEADRPYRNPAESPRHLWVG